MCKKHVLIKKKKQKQFLLHIMLITVFYFVTLYNVAKNYLSNILIRSVIFFKK